MKAVEELEHSYLLAKTGVGDYHDCIDWAVERIEADEEEGDVEVVQLATSTGRFQALALTEHLVERYCGHEALDPMLAAGKTLVAMRHDYLRGVETVRSLASKLPTMSRQLAFPSWMTVLCRNCKYATVVPEFLHPFEEEFAYLARLWVLAKTRAEFEDAYKASISRRHDAFMNGVPPATEPPPPHAP
jgi:hypothetical protein